MFLASLAFLLLLPNCDAMIIHSNLAHDNDQKQSVRLVECIFQSEENVSSGHFVPSLTHSKFYVGLREI